MSYNYYINNNYDLFFLYRNGSIIDHNQAVNLKSYIEAIFDEKSISYHSDDLINELGTGIIYTLEQILLLGDIARNSYLIINDCLTYISPTTIYVRPIVGVNDSVIKQKEQIAKFAENDIERLYMRYQISKANSIKINLGK